MNVDLATLYTGVGIILAGLGILAVIVKATAKGNAIATGIACAREKIGELAVAVHEQSVKLDEVKTALVSQDWAVRSLKASLDSIRPEVKSLGGRVTVLEKKT